MRTLITSVGTRGDVQPALALALQLRALGGEARLCVSPNFVAWISDLGFDARPMGVEMRAPPRGAPPVAPVPDLIADQFETLQAAAEGCDLIAGAGAHQYAARSIAEVHEIPCVAAVYAPVALPSRDHAPPGPPRELSGPQDRLQAWRDHRRAWNDRSLARVNANRARLGLAPVDDVLGHILGDEPWLAADPVLGPAPSGTELRVVQTGAWMLADETPLSAELEAFLAAGDPPVYAGLGSMPADPDLGRTLVQAARTLGRRIILARGWAELDAGGDAPDCLAIDEVNHQALFPRLAAVVHHGGAGTTAAAARAGAPQVVTPMFSDQFFWAGRVCELGVGSATSPGPPTPEVLTAALAEALEPGVAGRARTLAAQVTPDGAAAAARRLLDTYG